MASKYLDGVPSSWWGKCAGAGAVGGVVMALWMMLASAWSGMGLWMPINLIGATLPAYRPPAANFVTDASLVGLGIHLITAVFWALVYGLVAALAFPSEARRPDMAALFGIAFGTLVWVVMGLGLGPWIDPQVRAADPVIFALGHVLYGLVTALLTWRWAGERELKVLSIQFAPHELETLTEERPAKSTGGAGSKQAGPQVRP